jgi:hypothetical protein
LAFELVTTILTGGSVGSLKQGGKLAKLLEKAKKLGGKKLDVGPAPVKGLIDDAFSASRQRMRIPTRVAGETIQKYIDESTELFRRAGGRFIDVDGPGPNGGLTLAQINFKDKIIYRFRGAEIQDTVEELLHFRQAQKAGLWGRGGVSKTMLELWETQVDNLFRNLGFVPR